MRGGGQENPAGVLGLVRPGQRAWVGMEKSVYGGGRKGEAVFLYTYILSFCRIFFLRGGGEFEEFYACMYLVFF